MSALDLIDDVARTSEAIAVAREVATHFLDHALSIHALRKPAPGTSKIISSGVATVRGRLGLSHQNIATNAVSRCSLTFLPNRRRVTPSLRCNAFWIRRPEDESGPTGTSTPMIHSVTYWTQSGRIAWRTSRRSMAPRSRLSPQFCIALTVRAGCYSDILKVIGANLLTGDENGRIGLIVSLG